jgi:hypothetical protein
LRAFRAGALGRMFTRFNPSGSVVRKKKLDRDGER